MVHLPGKGIGSRRVPLLLPEDVIPAMDTLGEYRNRCDVLPSNVYFFAIPGSHDGYFNEWQVMANVCNRAGLSNPRRIRSTNLENTLRQLLRYLSNQ